MEKSDDHGFTVSLSTITPYLGVRGAVAAINLYRRGVRAQRKCCDWKTPAGMVARARDPHRRRVAAGRRDGGQSAAKTQSWLRRHFDAAVRLYVDDVDACFARALAAGGVQLLCAGSRTGFYGDRNGALRNPSVTSDRRHAYRGPHSEQVAAHCSRPACHQRRGIT